MKKVLRVCLILAAIAVMIMPCFYAQAFELNVVDSDDNPVSGFRWLLEEDTTNYTTPGAQVADSISLDVHNSYCPVVTKGHSDTSSAVIDVPPDMRYFVSVLPDSGYSLGGTSININQLTATVKVHANPIPTAQITVNTFVDQNPINNITDVTDQPLGGVAIILHDDAGQVMMDAFGNPLGTTYDAGGNVMMMGDGNIHTLTQADFDAGNNPYNLEVGQAVIKNLLPNKYGIIAIPPASDDSGSPVTWVQTTTIEGTPTIDAWVKPNEPSTFVEGFGTGFTHASFGFVKTSPQGPSMIKGISVSMPPWNVTPPAGTGSIEGTLRTNHFSAPPNLQGYHTGDPISSAWVGLNDPLAQPGTTASLGLYAAPCDEDGHFLIENIPAGTYELVTWDEPLDTLFGTYTVTIGEGEHINLGDILTFRWFGRLDNYVFHDVNENGFRDIDDVGMPEQNVNIRFRDGTIYQAFPTDLEGYVPFDEVFPFFKWLVVEVDFARFKATGMTAVVDAGGAIDPLDPWTFDGALNPQIQPDTGLPYRTETGSVLTQAMHLFLGQKNVILWGKKAYEPGENGGISGIVFYAITRAEDDPRYAAGEPWEPGIPRVQVNLYRDNLNNTTLAAIPDGIIDDLNADGQVTLADVDNYPFGNFPQAEDVDRNSNGIFDLGDALETVTTDCWNDNKPTGSVRNPPPPVIHGLPTNPNADTFGTWNQIRPGIFDGGYAFNNLASGTYIVEAIPPAGYEIVKEEDKNVDFGDEFTPSTLVLPPVCVGEPHLVPAELTLFPGVPCRFAGQMRPLADRKQIAVNDGKNAAVDFHCFTEVPKAARAVGFVNNDLGAEFNQASPNFGEKLAPSWIPISFKDWTGHEITRIYADEFGGYEALIPSTYTINAPTPTGVSPNMLTLVLNDPILPDGSQDPFYDPAYSVTPWTFNYTPGHTSYLDTPLVPLQAFTTAEQRVDTEPETLSPVIASVNGPEAGGGPYILFGRITNRILTITSKGLTQVPNPLYSPAGIEPLWITRDYGFGNATGEVTIGDVSVPIISWSDADIVVEVPRGTPTGRLIVRRGDNDAITELGVTVHLDERFLSRVRRVPSQYPTIQAAIDAALPGNLIIVAPGNYNENIVMHKPVKLQGSGTGATMIYANPNPLEKLQAWHQKVDSFKAPDVASFLLKNPFQENEAPGIIVFGRAEIQEGNVLDPQGDAIPVLGSPFLTSGQSLIDGFTISGSLAGGGIFAMAGARYLTISNNNITNNQGNYAGGISIGTPETGWNSDNTNIRIRYNKIHKNGGIQGAGGIAMNESSDNYAVENNIIAGNFGRFNGAGISHRGASLGNNIISHNKIIFNENFFGAVLNLAGEGGGIYVGGDVAAGTGTGHVTIDANLIQGNLAGAGHGGGICAFAVNGDDIRLSPANDANWYRLRITNNIIVNNVSALAGAGIFLSDVARSTIAHNTIANNDTTSTAALAFQPGQTSSMPQAAGVVTTLHSGALQALFDASLAETFCNPVLVNNIVRNNRSFYEDMTLNDGYGGLLPNPSGPNWDLNVLDSTIDGDPHLSPQKCLLTTRIDPVTGHDYGASPINEYFDPGFESEYQNVLESTIVVDEGGNNINVRFLPISPGTSDYHIQAASPAVNAGNNSLNPSIEELDIDFDMQNRPRGAQVDIGADEQYDTTIPPASSLTLTSPNDGETLVRGTAHTITWDYTGSPGASIRIDLLRNGAFNRTIATSAPIGNGGSGSFTWNIPLAIPLDNTYRIRIRSVENNAIEDISDSNFSISQPFGSFTVTSPIAGETLFRGTAYSINWNYTGNPGGSVRLYLLRNGAVYRLISISSPIGETGSGSYNWIIPNNILPGSVYSVRVQSTSNLSIQDVSDGNFTIN